MKVADASLIITVLNEQDSITGFLGSIGAQSVRPAEIVIVDGGSTDGTVDMIRSWEAPQGTTVTLISSPGASISAGRNQAIAAAGFERLLVTDAGTEVDPGWVGALLVAAEAHDADVVSGFFYPTGETWKQRTIAFTITPTLSEIDGDRFLPSSRSISFTKAAWRAGGGYPEWLDYCEDLVFDMDMRAAGMTFTFEPRALVSWSARPSLRGFAKQYYRYARGDGKASLWRKRHLIRYSAYVGGMVLVAAGFVSPWWWAGLLAGFGAYMSKFWGRVARRRSAFGAGAGVASLMVPIVVIVGDVAKMIGYPVGLRWRSRRPR